MKAVAAHNNETRAFFEAQIYSWPVMAGLVWLVLSPFSFSSLSLTEAALPVSLSALVALPVCALLLSLLLISPWASRR